LLLLLLLLPPATSSLKAYNAQKAHSPARSHAAYRRRWEVPSNRLHSLWELYCSTTYFCM